MKNLGLRQIFTATLFCTTSAGFLSEALGEPILLVTEKARPSDANLKIKTSLVPTFEVYQKKTINGKIETFKIKNIPALNIGSERKVQASELSPLYLPSSTVLNLKPIQKSKPLELFAGIVFKEKEAPLATVNLAKALVQSNGITKIPDLKPIELITTPPASDPIVNLTPLKEMNANDYKLLQALIFLESRKQYEMAMGLFAELMEDPVHRIEALYNYAMTAKGLELNSEFRYYMILVAQESKSKIWQEKATEALVRNISILEKSDIGLIDPLVVKYDLDTTHNDDYQITRAKYYSDIGQLGLVEDSLLSINDKSPRYLESLLLKSLLSYRQGQLDEAIESLELLVKASESNKTLQIRNVAALTLARMQFQKGLFKESFQSYIHIDKTSPLWLQAMIESSWTQILAQDYEGATGNMFSLHTDFFKNAFVPESYVVRTVGYLNLCQYGDGAMVINEMKKKYGPWKKRLEQYIANNKESLKYYETVKSWIKNSDLKEMDELPRSFIVELARHPSFINIQKQINNYEDEIVRFNKIALTLVKIERNTLSQKNAIQKELNEVKAKSLKDLKNTKAAEEVQLTEKKLLSYGIQYRIAQKARDSIKNVRTLGLQRIDKEKNNMRLVAGNNLQTHFKEMLGNLNKVLDQNEILSYELYSGAGEHLRYQLAGGDINSKEHPELKVQDEKSLNWKFKGEFWEDEVGHYRSSLKNVCPKEENSNEVKN